MTELTKGDIETTYKVLETLREEFADEGMVNEAETMDNAHYLVQVHGEEKRQL